MKRIYTVIVLSPFLSCCLGKKSHADINVYNDTADQVEVVLVPHGNCDNKRVSLNSGEERSARYEDKICKDSPISVIRIKGPKGEVNIEMSGTGKWSSFDLHVNPGGTITCGDKTKSKPYLISGLSESDYYYSGCHK